MSGAPSIADQYANRQGILPISWADFHGLCKGLALAAAGYDPQVILGIARGGMYAATLLSHLLRREFYPIRLTRRLDDRVVRPSPVWSVRPPEAVAGRRVLVVDEIASSGETLRMACGEALQMGATAARSAVLYAHTWGSHVPDYCGIISDALILNPWDREALQDGRFVVHPEYVEALSLQGLPASEGLLLGIAPVIPAKDGTARRE